MATKKLRSQVMENLYELIWALAVFGISVYAGIQTYFRGSGNRTEPEKGLRGQFKRLLYWLEDTGHKKLVLGILLTIFGVAAIICLCLIVYHVGYLTPRRSVLGRSILAQASAHEVFDDLVHAIDQDLAMESREFGTELLVGAQWLLSEQSMRIGKIRRLYVGQRKKKQYVLLAADEEGHTLEAVFSWNQNRDEAVQYLQRRIPELYVGNLKEVE